MDGNGIGMFMEQGMRRRQHLPWDGVGCWLMPCPSWSVSQSCMRMKGSRPFCVSLLHGLGRDSMSLTLPWDRPSTWVWCRCYVLGCCLAIVHAEQEASPAALGQGAGWVEGTGLALTPHGMPKSLGPSAWCRCWDRPQGYPLVMGCGDSTFPVGSATNQLVVAIRRLLGWVGH